MTRSQHEINLWMIPLKMSIASLVLFALTMIPDTLAAYNIIHLPSWFTMGGIDDARAILGAMLGCVSTVLALIFSVALLMLSMVATLFGPRLLYRFVQDWVTQATIGLFMAAFIYVFLVFLVTHQDANGTFVPQVSLIMSWIVVLAAFSFLVFYSHRIAVSIQNPDAIARIVDDIRRTQQKAVQNKIAGTASSTQYRINESGIVKSSSAGYVQEIDCPAIANLAEKADAVVQMAFRPGQFVLQGEALAFVWPATGLSALDNAINERVSIGRHRVLSQDAEFGIAQIVEIAIRALSPAINDTFTGIACVDCLGEALVLLGESPQPDGNWYGGDGKLRLRERIVPLDRLIKQAFDQVRQAAVDNPAVQIRLLYTIERVGRRISAAKDRAALMKQSTAILDMAKSRSPARMDLEDIESAWRNAAAALQS